VPHHSADIPRWTSGLGEVSECSARRVPRHAKEDDFHFSPDGRIRQPRMGGKSLLLLRSIPLAPARPRLTSASRADKRTQRRTFQSVRSTSAGEETEDRDIRTRAGCPPVELEQTALPSRVRRSRGKD